jgi:two-component system response regulator PilR (NtrC family)
MGLAKHVLDKNALKAIVHHSFPGNVRELENILERAITLCEGNTITADDIQLPHSEENFSLDGSSNQLKQIGLDNYLAEIEKRIIVEALQNNRFNKTAAAKQLGISLRSFRYRLQRLDIE